MTKVEISLLLGLGVLPTINLSLLLYGETDLRPWTYDTSKAENACRIVSSRPDLERALRDFHAFYDEKHIPAIDWGRGNVGVIMANARAGVPISLKPDSSGQLIISVRTSGSPKNPNVLVFEVGPPPDGIAYQSCVAVSEGMMQPRKPSKNKTHSGSDTAYHGKGK